MNVRQAATWFGIVLFISLLAVGCGGGGGSNGASLSITTTTLPDGFATKSYSATLSATGGKLPYTWSLFSGSLPPGISLGTSGSLSGTPTMLGQSTFTVQVTDSNRATATQALTITVDMAPQPLELSGLTLPEGLINVVYNASVQAGGGVTPYTYAITGGSLPTGLTMSSAGVISGTPTQAVTSNFTVQVTDSEAPPQTASGQFSLTIAATPVVVTTTTLPDAVLFIPYTSPPLQATGGIPPYSWSGQGLEDHFHVDSGGVVTTISRLYQGGPTQVGTQTFTATAKDSGGLTGSKTLTITTDLGGNVLLKGTYSFYVSGFGPGGTSQWATAGGFVADGNGNITSGEIDSNSTNGAPINSAITGTYTIAANGLGQMTLTSANSSMTFAFVMSPSSGKGKIIEFDDASGQGSRAAGSITPQYGNLPVGDLAGRYGFGYSGQDVGNSNRLAEVGIFTLGQDVSISDGAADSNDGGAMSSLSLTGNMSPAFDSSGRALMKLTVTNNGVQHDEEYATYQIRFAGDDAGFYAVRIDPINGSGQLLSGPILQGCCTDRSVGLEGTLVMQASGLVPGQNPSGVAAAGLATFDGMGNISAVDIEQNTAGSFTDFTGGGTYSVSANGRVVLTAPGLPAVGYVFDGNEIFAISNDNSATLAFLEFQNPPHPVFSNASLSGYNQGVSLAPIQSNPITSVYLLNADGNGNVTGLADISGPNGLQSDVNTSITYSINALGMSPLSGSVGGYMYVGAAYSGAIVVTDETDPRLLTIMEY